MPVNVAEVTEAIESMLRAWPSLQQVQNIEQGAEINEEPRRCPWIGIYRMGVKFPSRTLGAGTGYRQNRIELIVVTQALSLQSGKECAIALEALNQQVIGCLLSDPSLLGTVDNLDEFEVRYPEYRKTANGFYQTALIYFTGVTNVTAT